MIILLAHLRAKSLPLGCNSSAPWAPRRVLEKKSLTLDVRLPLDFLEHGTRRKLGLLPLLLDIFPILLDIFPILSLLNLLPLLLDILPLLLDLLLKLRL